MLWVGAFCQETVSWADVNPDLCRQRPQLVNCYAVRTFFKYITKQTDMKSKEQALF